MSVANGAFGQSAEGAFIKSAQGARGWADTEVSFLLLQVAVIAGNTHLDLKERGDQTAFYSSPKAIHLYTTGDVLWNTWDTGETTWDGPDATDPASDICHPAPIGQVTGGAVGSYEPEIVGSFTPPDDIVRVDVTESGSSTVLRSFNVFRCHVFSATNKVYSLEPAGIALLALADNSTIGFPGAPSDDWSTILRVDTDLMFHYPDAASTYSAIIGGMAEESFSGISHVTTSFSRETGCGGTHTGSWTNFVFSTFLVGPAPGESIDITIKQGATVIDAWVDVPLCAFVDPPIQADPDTYYFRTPPWA